MSKWHFHDVVHTFLPSTAIDAMVELMKQFGVLLETSHLCLTTKQSAHELTFTTTSHSMLTQLLIICADQQSSNTVQSTSSSLTIKLLNNMVNTKSSWTSATHTFNTLPLSKYKLCLQAKWTTYNSFTWVPLCSLAWCHTRTDTVR